MGNSLVTMMNHVSQNVSRNCGGLLTKAQLIPVESHTWQTLDRPGLGPVTLMFNPARVQWSHQVNWDSQKNAASDSAAKSFGGSQGRTVTLEDIRFDTFERRANVRLEFIDRLESLCQRAHEEDHAPPYVLFVWGEFGATVDKYNVPLFVVQGLNVSYTMFGPDGTPYRAVVKLTLQEATPPEWQAYLRGNRSPDHAKQITVRRGDTLATIAHKAYEDAGQWRRIAMANNIDDPLDLAPGMVLMIPPILK
ncbi:MAG: LysM peptidoglycan-binding domain-containing protein [Myxococcales bacterium]|nr:LysM peptidoglycan-binding domain-containing protein [Myxococcales bacterium]